MTEETKTLGEISHTNPYTDRAFGETQAYDRGRTVAADGGESESESDADGNTSELLADIDHTLPNEEKRIQRTFDRGKRP